MGILISNAVIVTVDPERRVLDPGSLYIEGDRIVDIGSPEAVAARHPHADQVIDGRGRIVLPGFVSVHNHLGYSIFRGRAEDVGHGAVLGLYVPMSDILRREERAVLSNLSAAELLCGGVTTILHMEEDADTAAPFVEAVGMRAKLGIMASDLDVGALQTGRMVFSERLREAQLAQATTFAEQMSNRANGRIQPVIAANTASTASPGLLQSLRDTAERLACQVSMHMGIGEAEDVQRLHGAGVFEFCRDNGFLDDRVIAVHCYDLQPGDADALAGSGAALAHCPLMNQFRGAIAPVETLRVQGVRVGLGIDNYFADHFEVMRSRIAVARIRDDDPSIVQSFDALADATIRSAEVLGWQQEIGSLEIGKKADLQIINTRRYGLSLMNDPVRTLTYHAHARDVETVIVDGAVVVEDGRLKGIDDEALIQEAADIGRHVWTRFKDRHGDYVAKH